MLLSSCITTESALISIFKKSWDGQRFVSYHVGTNTYHNLLSIYFNYNIRVETRRLSPKEIFKKGTFTLIYNKPTELIAIKDPSYVR